MEHTCLVSVQVRMQHFHCISANELEDSNSALFARFQMLRALGDGSFFLSMLLPILIPIRFLNSSNPHP